MMLGAETLARWSLEGKTAIVTGGTKVGLGGRKRTHGCASVHICLQSRRAWALTGNYFATHHPLIETRKDGVWVGC